MGRLVVGIAVVAAIVGVAPAHASPNGPLPPPPPCQFALSVTHTDAVVATVVSTGCAAAATPYSAVACLRPGDGVETCVQSRGTEPAQVVLPYQPGVTFTANGRGCAGWIGLPPAADCQLLGPNRITG